MIDELIPEGHGRISEAKIYVEIMACRIYGKTVGMIRSGRCEGVAYCGREHQRADWNEHKKSCIPKGGEGS